MVGDLSVKAWVARISPKTGRDYQYTFERFMKWLSENGGEFASYSPDDLVSFQQSADNGSKYKILDLIQTYVSGLDLRIGSKTRNYAILRSFFTHNRVEVPKDPSFTLRSEKSPVQGTLTLEELKTVIISAKPVYRAIFLSMFQAGMGVGELEYWNLNGWASVKEQLQAEADIIRINLPGRKKRKNRETFYTFIGLDAIKALRGYLPERPRETEAIFVNQYGGPIRSNAVKLYWKRHLVGLGIMKPQGNGYSGNRYGKNLHEVRDLFRTQWEKSAAKGSVAEFMMGHSIDPNEYNKAHREDSWAKKEYRKALSYLQIMSSAKPFGQVDEDEVVRLRRELEEAKRGQNVTVQELKDELDIIKRALSHPEGAPILWKALKELEEKTR